MTQCDTAKICPIDHENFCLKVAHVAHVAHVVAAYAAFGHENQIYFIFSFNYGLTST